MRTLVTGATGTLGWAIARHLVAEGHSVRALVRGQRTLPEGVEPVPGDVTRPETLAAAMEGIQWVFHAAGIPETWLRDPGLFDRVNRQGTANVLDAALAAGVQRVVYTSTMDVFRKGPDGMLREDLIDLRPKPTAYERSKQQAEAEVERRLPKLDVVLLNPAAIYGPSPSDTGLTELFRKLMKRASPLLPPGGMSVAYVDEVARAHVTAASEGRRGERYLLSDGYHSLRDLAACICEEAGLGAPPRTAPAWLMKAVAWVSDLLGRAFGLPPLVSPGQLHFLLWQARVDSSKAQRELGYRPRPLREGVRRTVDHLRAGRP